MLNDVVTPGLQLLPSPSEDNLALVSVSSNLLNRGWSPFVAVPFSLTWLLTAAINYVSVSHMSTQPCPLVPSPRWNTPNQKVERTAANL